MHGGGERRLCPECGQSVAHMRDVLAVRELRGPRQITASNIDRALDDNGRRFLLIEEKNPNEPLPHGQARMLQNLATIPGVEVWGVRGTPDNLTVKAINPEGPSTTIRTGNWNDYQQAVMEWFNTEPPSVWNRALSDVCEMPYEAPSWCPPEVWAEFDRALTAVRAHLSRAA